MQVVYAAPHALTPVVTQFCPGCTHRVIHPLVAEVMDELNNGEKPSASRR